MSPRARALHALVVVAILLGLSGALTTVASAAAPSVGADISVSITGFAPRLPDVAKPTQKVSIGVRIVNASNADYSGLTLQLDRGSPMTTEKAVDAALVTPPPALDINLPATKVSGTVFAGQTRTQTLKVLLGSGGLCLGCGPEAGSIYPIDVSLHAGSEELARAHTLLPAFKTKPQPVQVSWLWPLIDGPHRALSATVFTDDKLAKSVAPDGRLDRVLQVVERVHAKAALTLVVDPDLIDSLSVMSSGYTVHVPGHRAHAGTGGAAAAAWLHRLHAVAATTPITLTSYADPDIDALTRAGIALPVTLDADVAARVRSVLGRVPPSTLVWPQGEDLTSRSLDAVVSNGATSVVLDDTALPGAVVAGPPTAGSGTAGPTTAGTIAPGLPLPSAGSATTNSTRTSTPTATANTVTATPDALSPLPAATGTATAIVLDSRLQDTVASLTARHPTTSAAAALLAQLAVRAAHQPGRPHYVALAPDRYVDPDVAVTSSTMRTLAGAPWSTGMTVATALTTVSPIDRGVLHPAADSAALAPQQTRTLIDVNQRVSTLRECLDNDGARRLVGGYTLALARASSTWWRTNPSGGQAYVNALRREIRTQEASIRIDTPANTSFTLGSSDAPFYVVVRNLLPVTTSFRLKVEPLNGEAGFRVDKLPVQTLEANGRREIKVGAHVEKSGRFPIKVTITSPGGTALSRSVPLRIHSTAYGRVGLWITGSAFAVLLVALAKRAVLRARRYWRGRKRDPQLSLPTSFPAPQ